MVRFIAAVLLVATALSGCRRRECGPGTVEVDRVCVPAPSGTATLPGVDDDRDGFTEAEGDCDDRDPNVSPTATDIVGDGVDQNCDRVDGTDNDGDGFASIASGGQDCDDQDASVFPGAPESTDDDTDRDCDGETGSLDPERVLFGDITFQAPDAMAAFCRRYDRVYGNVVITGELVDSVADLNCLVQVVGDLSVLYTGVQTLRFDNLDQVGGRFIATYNDSLRALDLPVLARAGGIEVSGAVDLASFEVPRLEVVAPWNLAVNSEALATVDVGELRVVGGELNLFGDELESVDLPLLEEVGGTFNLNVRWSNVDFDAPVLTHVGSLNVHEVAGLQDLIAFSALRTVGKDLMIFNNPDLNSIDELFGIESIGNWLIIESNPQLPESQVQQLVSEIGEENIGGMIRTGGNSGS